MEIARQQAYPRQMPVPASFVTRNAFGAYAQLLSEPFRWRYCWRPIPDSSVIHLKQSCTQYPLLTKTLSSASFRANTAALAAYFPKDSSAIGWHLDGVAMGRNNVAREEKAVRRVTVSKLSYSGPALNLSVEEIWGGAFIPLTISKQLG